MRHPEVQWAVTVFPTVPGRWDRLGGPLAKVYHVRMGTGAHAVTLCVDTSCFGAEVIVRYCEDCSGPCVRCAARAAEIAAWPTPEHPEVTRERGQTPEPRRERSH